MIPELDTLTLADRVPWYLRHSNFRDVETLGDVDEAVEAAGSARQWTCVVIYAPWCNFCKTVFPELGKISKDETIAGKFQFLRVSY